MSTATHVAEAYRSVVASAERIKNDEHQVVQFIDPGYGVRQGDIYVIMLDVAPAKQSDYQGRQLAQGTTQGSRHVIEGDCELYTPNESEATAILNRLVPETVGERQFIGPVIKLAEPCRIAHPEHGDITIPIGTYLVTYQKVQADEVRRAMD